MNVEPCNVCGGTDMNLVDGFYYCVECGTQDVNVRETIVEDRALADGTFTLRRHVKVAIAAEETEEMSGEWHKWHAYNFMLSGLADELIEAGAKPSVKMKILWLWTKYIKKFQNKDELGLTKEDEETDQNTSKRKKKTSDYRSNKMDTDLSIVRRGVLCSLLYAALNLDCSEILLCDLLRFIREGRVDLNNCEKFVPKEIKLKLIPQWTSFKMSRVGYIHVSTLSMFKCLNIVPIMPDLKLIVDRFVKELCLPDDFKNLVFSLMHLVPCDAFLEMDKQILKSLLRIPPYENTVMAYILVAFKMCFGLDDDYEVKISDVVEKINDYNCNLKSYKLGDFSERSDRLFSFREWCRFLQLRKIILCKYYLCMAEHYSLEIDDYVYMEQCRNREKKREPWLSDEITMNILEKIPQVSNVEVIPKTEFKATLTPWSTYTDLVLQYFKDPDLRLLLSEDFTQYSLKYACENLYLSDEEDVRNIILGVDNTKKNISKKIQGLFDREVNDVKMVYIRNCENKNWLKTNQPSVEHVQKVIKNNNDIVSDHGYDSNTENTPEIEISSRDESSSHNSVEDAEEKIEVNRKLEIVEEEELSMNIFDDDFEGVVFVEEDNLIEEDKIKSEVDDNEDNNHHQHIDTFHDNPFSDNHNEVQSNISHDDSVRFFNPDTFDRSRTIKELVLGACKKYKITIPNEYNTKEPTKRKSKLVKDMTGESGAKRRRVEGEKRKKCKPAEVREQVHQLLADYYNNLKNDVMFQISEHVKSVVNNVSRAQNTENTEIEDNNDLVETDRNEDVTAQDPTVIDDGASNNADTNENTEINNTSLEQNSLHIIENEDEEENQRKSDPRFDEKEFDVKQLYVKVDGEEGSDSDDVFGLDNDSELVAILDKKIEQVSNGEMPHNTEEVEESTIQEESDDSDDDTPLSVLKENKIAMQQKKSYREISQNLVVKQEHITEFKYWTKFYDSQKMRKLYDLNESFNLELQEKFPTSFLFVIRECAEIVDCSPYQLYKSMIALEQRILTHKK